MFADLELALQKADQSFHPIRQQMKEDKQRGYTVVRAPCTLHNAEKDIAGHMFLGFGFLVSADKILWQGKIVLILLIKYTTKYHYCKPFHNSFADSRSI